MPRLLTLLASIVVLTICIGLNVHRYPMVRNLMRQAGPVISVSVSPEDAPVADAPAEDAVRNRNTTPPSGESGGAAETLAPRGTSEPPPAKSDVSLLSEAPDAPESGLVELKLPEQPMELPAEPSMPSEPRRTERPITLTSKTQPLPPQNTADTTVKRVTSASSEKAEEHGDEHGSEENSPSGDAVGKSDSAELQTGSPEPPVTEPIPDTEPKADAEPKVDEAVAETGVVSKPTSPDAAGWESRRRPMTRQEIRSWLRQRN